MTQKFTVDEIMTADSIRRAKTQLEPISTELMSAVGNVVQELGWTCQYIITEAKEGDDKSCVSSIKINIPDTNYVLQVVPPIIQGTFCKLRTRFVAGDNHSRMVYDVCARLEDFKDVCDNVYSRIDYWEMHVMPMLVDHGFTSKNWGEMEWQFEAEHGGFWLKVLPSLFPGCVAVLLRQKNSAYAGSSDMIAKDWEAKDLDMATKMVDYLVHVDPLAESFPTPTSSAAEAKEDGQQKKRKRIMDDCDQTTLHGMKRRSQA